MLCGRAEQRLLHDWHGELVGEAGWAELSTKYAKKEELNLMNGRLGRKARNEQE